MCDGRRSTLTEDLNICSNGIIVIGRLGILSRGRLNLLPRVSEIMAARAATAASGRFSSNFDFSAACKCPPNICLVSSHKNLLTITKQHKALEEGLLCQCTSRKRS